MLVIAGAGTEDEGFLGSRQCIKAAVTHRCYHAGMLVDQPWIGL